MDCSVIIVSYNTRDILAQCLDVLFSSRGQDSMEVFVVDNASSDGSAEMVRERFSRVKITAVDTNLGFARANNLAFQASSGEFVVLLNPDAFVDPDTISNGLAFMRARPDCAACGGLIRGEDGGLAPSARRFPTALAKFCRMWGLADLFKGSPLFDRWDYRDADLTRAVEVDWVPGTFTVLRRRDLEALGFFDERFFMYYEETDLCLRFKRSGRSVWFTPDVRLSHIGGASAKTVKKQFEASGAQVMGWRLRSEYLYFRKNFGPWAVLGNSGVEMARHGVRWLRNCFSRRVDASVRRRDSAMTLALCWAALRDTKFGTASPPIPW